MYDYDFGKEKEKVKVELNEIFVESNENVKKVSMLITNKNVLFFYNMNEGNVLNSRGMYMPPEYTLIFKIPLDNLKYTSTKDKTTIIYNNNEIIIHDFDLKTVL